jgi:tRNA U34 5-methylaminomethyl-2-thiouridine-forming methyltransferase MnmC
MITLLETADGSQTLKNNDTGESYHSTHGAVQESMHVYIEHGLKVAAIKKSKIRVFELGFGTGLNALLTLREVMENADLEVEYVCIEPFPLPESVYRLLNYPKENELDYFIQMHQSVHAKNTIIHERFSFLKMEIKFEDFKVNQGFDLVYYDAFAPTSQPELWNMDTLKMSFDLLNSEGIWVTYCSKGEVRRGLVSLGMNAVRLAGPPGKRHMIFATKP